MGTKNKRLNSGKQGKDDNRPSTGAFSRFFNQQQRKVNHNKRVSGFLGQFAEQDLQRVAAMIDKWLAQDDKGKNKPSVKQHKRNK